jgi:hypothetical protein
MQLSRHVNTETTALYAAYVPSKHTFAYKFIDGVLQDEKPQKTGSSDNPLKMREKVAGWKLMVLKRIKKDRNYLAHERLIKGNLAEFYADMVTEGNDMIEILNEIKVVKVITEVETTTIIEAA